MTTTAGVFEAFAELFIAVPEELGLEDASIHISVRGQYVFGFLTTYSDIAEGKYTAEALTKLGAKELSRDQLRKYAAMDTADFAQALFNIATQKGKYSRNSVTIQKYLTRAVYVFYQVENFINWQNENFSHVAQNKGVNALAFINSGTLISLDDKTRAARIAVNDVTFEIANYTDGISTAALMLNDMFLKFLAETRQPSFQIELREIARIKGRSTTKQAINKLHHEVVAWMDEIANIKYRCREKVDGKWIESGEISINGGTHFVRRGVVFWNYNADLSTQLTLLAPMDFPNELWKADPRTNQYYFGRYIAQNYRLNEGKKGRDRIPLRTLISKSPNMPTYEEVMHSNRNVTDRIVRKTFADLDALEHIFYTVVTSDGKEIRDPLNMDYDTFIEAYVVIDYSDYPAHAQRLANNERRRKRMKEEAEHRKAKKAAEEAAKA